jgi:hypothetical protein
MKRVKFAALAPPERMSNSYRRTRRRMLFLVAGLIALGAGWLGFSGNLSPAGMAQERASEDVRASMTAQRQIMALMREKESRTPAQRKVDSQLLYSIKSSRNELAVMGVEKLETGVKVDEKNRTVVDIICNDLKGALARIEKTRAVVLKAVINTIRAEVPMGEIETIAAWPEVRFIWPKQEMVTMGAGSQVAYRREGLRRQLASVLPRFATKQRSDDLQTAAIGQIAASEGERAHGVDQARRTYGANGNGVKIGVISNGVNQWEQLRFAQELPDDVTVLQDGQSILGELAVLNEGAAMLEIIHDLAPGAKLFFAGIDGLAGIAGFAQAIRDLRAAGCDIIVDDIRYIIESPFHDGQAPNVASLTNAALVTQAVNEVTADGALYFSAAGNFGNLNDGTSSVYEHDFVDGGTLPLIPGGTVHAFSPGVTSNQRTAIGGGTVFLWWSDPLGGSANDYDLYLLDSTGSRVVAVSNNIQDGIQDPVEAATSSITGARIVILKKTGAQDRFLHLQSIEGKMAFSTAGEITGHPMAANAYAVAATPAARAFRAAPNPTGPYPNLFNSSNQSELFTSDGPRRIFYKADGTPYTLGDVSGTGGILRQKPDITAADGVSCATPGFAQFFGTSAAAPHAAAIAALIKSAAPGITPAQMRTALIASAIDIEAPGVDRDTGAGIIMALEALRAAGADPLPLPVPDLSATGYTAESNANGQIDPGETVSISLCLRNAGAPTTASLAGTLRATGNVIDPSGPRNFSIRSYGTSNCQPFTFKIGGEYGEIVRATLSLTLSGPGLTRELGTVTFPLGPIGTPQSGVELFEIFRLLTELPPGWTTTTSGAGEPWATLGESDPGVFTPLTAATGESSLVSPPIPIASPRARLRFLHSFLTGSETALDFNPEGGVLEIKIGDGDFQDILEAGGSFEAGGYTRTITTAPTCSEPNPLGSRRGWASDHRQWSLSQPYFPGLPSAILSPFVPSALVTEVNLPPGAAGQIIQLRWRFGADCFGAIEGGGWRIHVVELISGYNNPIP